MRISLTSSKVTPRGQALICLQQFQEDKTPSWDMLVDRVHPEIRKILDLENFKPEKGKSTLIHAGGGRILVTGLGPREKFDWDVWRESVARGARRARDIKAAEIYFLPADHPILEDQETMLNALAESIELSLYKFEKYRSEKEKFSPESAHVVTAKAHARNVTEIVRRAHALAQSVNFARDLINEPACNMTPQDLADAARSLSSGIDVTVHDEHWIQKMKMGGIWGVARGSRQAPRFIELRYQPSRASKGSKRSSRGPVALIGKGITFDSGGLSLKPAKSMETMKSDMSGAAAVIGTFKVLKEIRPDVVVHGFIAAVENMPGGNAYRPGDILTSLNGKTIEVNNTDAEGRVTLADVLTYATRLKPRVMIDLATLTGACVVALGEKIAGAFSNDEKLLQEFINSAKRSGEKVWPLPLFDDYKFALKSDVADLKNAGERYGGAITAALFLKEFVKDIPWIHLDIAGPAFAEKDQPCAPKGGTGFGVRTLLDYILHL